MKNERYSSELEASWRNQKSHTNFDPTRSRQTVPAITDLTNAAGAVSLYQPQIHHTDAPLTRKEAWSPKTLQTKQNNIVQATSGGTPQNSMLTQIAIGTVIGLVVSGVPLAIMLTLYVQALSSSNSSNNSSSSASSTTLPSQCTSYTINTDVTRNVGYTGCSGCYCDNGLTAGWYRFMGSAGTALITSVVSTNMCGAVNPGWFNGTFPSTAGGTTSGTVCVNYSGTLCYSGYSVTSVGVTNCSGFYVFYLTTMTSCARYCTT